MNIESLNQNLTLYPNESGNISVTNPAKKHKKTHVNSGISKGTSISPKPTNLLKTDLGNRKIQQTQVQSNWLEQMLSSDGINFNYKFYQRKVNKHFKNGIRNGDQSVKNLVELLDTAVISTETDGGRQLYKIISLIRAMLSLEKSLFTKKQLENVINGFLKIIKTHPGNGTFIKNSILTATFGILSDIICGYELNSNTIENIKKVLLLEYQQTRIPSIRRNARNLLFDLILNCGLQGLDVNELVMEFSLKDVYFLINEALDVCRLDVCRDEKDLQKAKGYANVLSEIIYACQSRGDVFPTLSFGESLKELNETLSAEDETEYKKAFEELETRIKLAAPSLLLPSTHLVNISDSEIQDIGSNITMLECCLKDGDTEQLPQAKKQLSDAISDLQNKNKNWQALINFASKVNDFCAEKGKFGFDELQTRWDDLKKAIFSSKETETAKDPFSKNVKQFKKLLNNFGNLTEEERDELTRLWNELKPGLSGGVYWTSDAVQHVDNFLKSNNTDAAVKRIWEIYPKNSVEAYTYAVDAYRGQDQKLKYWTDMSSAFSSFRDLVAVHECDPKTYVEQKLKGTMRDNSGQNNNCCFISILNILNEKFPDTVPAIWPDPESLRTGIRQFLRNEGKADSEVEKLNSGKQVDCTGDFAAYISDTLGMPVAITVFEDSSNGGKLFKIPGNITAYLPNGTTYTSVVKDSEEISLFIKLAIDKEKQKEKNSYKARLAAIKKSFCRLDGNGNEVVILNLYHNGDASIEKDGNGNMTSLQTHGHYQAIMRFEQK